MWRRREDSNGERRNNGGGEILKGRNTSFDIMIHRYKPMNIYTTRVSLSHHQLVVAGDRWEGGVEGYETRKEERNENAEKEKKKE